MINSKTEKIEFSGTNDLTNNPSDDETNDGSELNSEEEDVDDQHSPSQESCQSQDSQESTRSSVVKLSQSESLWALSYCLENKQVLYDLWPCWLVDELEHRSILLNDRRELTTF